MNNRYIWFALGIGAALGSSAALLFAPQSGSKTRKQLGRALDDASGLASGYAGDASDYLQEQSAKLSAEAQKALKVAGDKAATLANTALDLSTTQVSAVKSMF